MGVVRAVAAVAAAIAAAGVPASAQAQDACPNASLRTGKQAALPDCRAWEQVSPADKNGVAVTGLAPSVSSLDGDRFFASASGAIVPTEAGVKDRSFLSTRTDGWSTVATDPPQIDLGGLAYTPTARVSDDGTKAIVVSYVALTPGAVAGDSNFYVRDLTRPNAYTLLATIPGRGAAGSVTNGRSQIVGATPDLSAIVLLGAQDVDPDLPTPQTGVGYLFLVGGGQVRLVSRLPSGEPATVGGSTGSPGAYPLSADGRTVVWKRAGPDDQLYRSTQGRASVELTRSRVNPSESGLSYGEPFTSADGTETTFDSGSPLTVGSTPGSDAIYRAEGDDLVDLTARFTRDGPGRTFFVRGVSPDRRFVWFVATALPAVDPPDDGFRRLFVLDTERRTLRRVAKFDNPGESAGPLEYRFSPDGRRVAFASAAALTGYDNRRAGCPFQVNDDAYCPQVFAFDAEAPDEGLVCASCGATGSLPAEATFGTTNRFPERYSRAIFDDGRVVFDTGAPLVAADTDRVRDVYQYTPGVGPQLLSAGATGQAASFADASADGSSVFFNTAQRLVAQDTDDLPDAYVARTNGGLAAQRIAPPVPAAPCDGDACRPAPGPRPATPEQGSMTFTGPPTTVVPRLTVRKPSAKALRAAARGGRLTLVARVTAPGTVAASLRGRFGGRKTRTAASATRKAGKAQTVRLPLRLSERARRTLRRSGRLSLRLTVSYSETLTRYRTTLTIQKGGAR